MAKGTNETADLLKRRVRESKRRRSVVRQRKRRGRGNRG